MEDIKKTIATEDVEKVSDRINKAHKRATSLLIWCIVIAISDFVSFLTGTAIILSKFMLEDMIDALGILASVAFAVLMISLMLLVFTTKLIKRAEKDTETLWRNCVRLKLTSQSYFTFLSLFVSLPDKVTFLQGPKTDDGKNMIILIWQSGKIETCEIGKEEATEIFEPMFK